MCRPGDIVLLAGDLGAGKTTLAQGFGRALGVEEPITSPTFVLQRHYHCAPGALGGRIQTLLHVDVYRLDRLAEVVDLGTAELVEDCAVALVEWGDVASSVLGADALVVGLVADLDSVEEGAPVRLVSVQASGETWLARRAALASALREWCVER